MRGNARRCGLKPVGAWPMMRIGENDVATPVGLVAPLTTLLVGGMLVVATQAAWPPPSCGPDQAKTQGVPSGDPNAVHVVVLSSSNKGGVMEEMACRFERTAPTVAGDPVDVVIVSEPSGDAIDKIGASSGLGSQPTVWTPASSSWVSMLQQQHPEWIPQIPPPWIAQSPQVIAMPRPIAEALGWPGAQLGWRDILDLATHPLRWAAEAPGFGTFKLAMTNPLFSTSGLNATVSTFRAATGHPTADLVKSEVGDGSVLRNVRRFESTVVHYATTSVDFLGTSKRRTMWATASITSRRSCSKRNRSGTTTRGTRRAIRRR